MFGTSVLQMNKNTILRLCKTNKYHFSIKQHNTQVESFNQIVSQLTQRLQTVDIDKTTELKEINNEELALDSLYAEIFNSIRVTTEITAIRNLWEMSKTQCLFRPSHTKGISLNN